MKEDNIPNVMSNLRQEIVRVPEIIKSCSGIRIYGRRIRSILFSTDVSIIANHDADAVLAVYPFPPHPAILKSIMMVASVPVFSGVGGGLTNGTRSANMSLLAESEGAYAVVLNGPTNVETIEKVNQMIDIPIIYTVLSDQIDLTSRIEAGVDILNISCGADTARVVKKIRQLYPDFPIIATGGPSEESILSVIQAGANAVTYTAPTSSELFKEKMKTYRNGKN